MSDGLEIKRDRTPIYVTLVLAIVVAAILVALFAPAIFPASQPQISVSIQNVQYDGFVNVLLTIISPHSTTLTSYTIWCQSPQYTNSTVNWTLTANVPLTVNIYSNAVGTNYADFGGTYNGQHYPAMNPYHIYFRNSNGSQSQTSDFNVNAP